MRVTTFKDKTVAVFGLGASGNATAKALIEGGARVAAWDDSEAGRASAAAAGIPLVDLRIADWSALEALVLAPGVPLTHPEPHWTVTKARAAAVEIIGDVELFFRERRATCPNAPVVAITGTNGKSTTTALIAHILREQGLDVQLGGNIGRAVLTLEPPAENRFYVLELSSFQIDLTPSLEPTVGVLLNVTPDHIDRHGTVEHYASVKAHLVAGAEAAVIGVEDAMTRAIAGRVSGKLYPFAVDANASIAPKIFASGTSICSQDGAIASIAGVRSLRGRHNAQNAAAAITAIRALDDVTAGSHSLWQPARLDAAMKTFPGLPHRLEEIASLGRMLFINDSKATNADSTEKALATWDSGIYWIVGGKPKDGGITTLEAYFPRLAKAYLIGEAADEFAKTLSGKVAFERSGTLEVAIASATKDASMSDAPEAIVLLSPACASYDQFKNFEVRGDTFRHLVAAEIAARARS
ncbi:MAG: UDP-N-acetylmuramoyl-L-alanine--D-glutamate ligase [Hyphomicrobium sp.]|jgi:UDP-N-acetylmuramoylalanine--D-glutamate ligase